MSIKIDFKSSKMSPSNVLRFKCYGDLVTPGFNVKVTWWSLKFEISKSVDENSSLLMELNVSDEISSYQMETNKGEPDVLIK